MPKEDATLNLPCNLADLRDWYRDQPCRLACRHINFDMIETIHRFGFHAGDLGVVWGVSAPQVSLRDILCSYQPFRSITVQFDLIVSRIATSETCVRSIDIRPVRCLDDRELS